MSKSAIALILAFAVANPKSLPFSWTVRFYYHLIRHTMPFVPAFLRPAPAPTPFTTRTMATFCEPLECDFNGHKSNSTYFTDLDIARSDLMIWVFQKFLIKSLKTKGWSRGMPYIPVASVQTAFKRQIDPLQSYRVKSRIIGWDDKWILVLSKFVVGKGETEKVAAVSLTKYVIKVGRKTVKPQDALDDCGLWTEQVDKQARSDFALAERLLEMDKLDEMDV
ncbi:hypothetical protein NADFUDRAFT_72162 [Nadsonia fulvescens var. elongata DSM 6958]|uniref:Thioesterase/thiol ester dehydrase-isomerase n=1 Tax=Nadsonia fulvescens var. elongata DSM 6958 TaxID=857566 RepID=A0A1E3PDB4_9ASCO|nr:hypothetical protein NADFUDRAFT_72162 [Nadsonia fulvescens var. elongata DSM 6958]